MRKKESWFERCLRAAALGAAVVLVTSWTCLPAAADMRISLPGRLFGQGRGARPAPERGFHSVGEGESLPEEAWEEPDILPPEVCIEMDGLSYSASDPEYYYRADNCGIRVFFSDHGQDLGLVRDRETGIYRVTIDGGCEKQYIPQGAAETEAVIEYTPEEVAALGDGAHTIAVTAVDAAGGWAEAVAAESRGCIFNGRTGRFVLDTTPPVFTLSVSAPEAARQGLCSQGNRFYFNSSFTARVTVSDENPDPAGISVLRGYTGGWLYDSSTAEVAAFEDRVEAESAVGDVVYTDTQKADGVYRYAVFGCDKAGNALVPLRETCLDGQDGRIAGETADSLERTADLSSHIVIDTVCPQAAYYVSNGVADYFRYRTDTGVSLSIPFRTETTAYLRAVVDEEIEHTPVRASLRTEARPSELSARTATDGYVYAPALALTQSGSQQFRLAGLTLTDLAGNVTRVASGNRIYLDDAGGVTDILPPAVEVSAALPSGAHAADGRPLYREDVTLKIRVTDPFPEESGSGIGEVTADVYVDGVWKEEESRLLHEGVRKEYDSDYADPVPLYDRTWAMTVPAAGHNTNEIRVAVRASDNAGNAAMDASFTFGIDTAPPAVSVSYDNNDVRNGSYFKASRTAYVTITERNFDPALVRLDTQASAAVSGWTCVPGSMENGDDDRWTAAVTFAADGEYTLDVDCRDAAGWPSPKASYAGAAPQAFRIDRTPPVVSVRWDNEEALNGCYYRKERNAVIVVEDVNFAGESEIRVTEAGGGPVPAVRFEAATAPASDGSLAGEADPAAELAPGSSLAGEASPGASDALSSHTYPDPGEATGVSRMEARLPFTAEGSYRFAGTVTDLAGNVSETFGEETFVIDYTPPGLAIEGVSDLSVNRASPEIILTAADENLDPERTSARLAGAESGERALGPVPEDGHPESGAKSGEMAGVSTSEDGRTVFRAESGQEDLPASAEAHGKLIRFTPGELAGDDYYRLTLTGTDLAGNRAERSVSFTVDREGPVFIFREREALKNGFARRPFRPSFRILDLEEVTILSVTVNGREAACTCRDNTLTLEEPVERDGIYVIAVEAVDAAGNPSDMEPVEFRLDTRPPVIRAEGLQKDQNDDFEKKSGDRESSPITLQNNGFEDMYTEPFDLIISHDRPEDRFTGFTLNGSELPLAAYMTENGSLSLSVEQYMAYRVEVTAADDAGNEATAAWSFELARYPAHPLRDWPAMAVRMAAAGFLVLIFRRQTGRGKRRRHHGG